MSIQAMSWALSIPIPPSPKLTLVAIGNYADENGHCFPSIKRLAKDSSQSYDTVSRRLRELEGMGLLVRIARHVSPEGVLNQEGRGRRTSDEIRLRLAVTPGEVEAGLAASDNQPQEPDESDDSSDPPTPQVAGGKLRGESTHSCAGADPALLRDPNEPSLEPKKDSPLPPNGGSEPAGEGIGSEAKPWPHEASWSKLEAAWADPILHQQICRTIWEALSDVERERFIRVARGYLAWRMQQPKLPNRCNIQKLMREVDAWSGYERLAGPDPSQRTFVAERSRTWQALQVAASIGGWLLPPSTYDPGQQATGFWRKTEVPADLLGLSVFADKPVTEWTTLEPGTKPFFAWSDRMFEWTGRRPEIMRVPCLWPPRRDGTISPNPDTG